MISNNRKASFVICLLFLYEIRLCSHMRNFRFRFVEPTFRVTLNYLVYYGRIYFFFFLMIRLWIGSRVVTWQNLWLVNLFADVADLGDVGLALTSPRDSSRDDAGGRVSCV